MEAEKEGMRAAIKSGGSWYRRKVTVQGSVDEVFPGWPLIGVSFCSN